MISVFWKKNIYIDINFPIFLYIYFLNMYYIYFIFLYNIKIMYYIIIEHYIKRVVRN